jgi:5-dehydro-2-deoxygluconokinase
MRQSGLDLICIGRNSVDFYAQEPNVSLADVRTFTKSVGGSPTNVAVAAARLGHRVGLVSKVGDDEWGRYVRSALQGFGVSTEWVTTEPGSKTPMAFVERHLPDHFPVLFYGQPDGPDMMISKADFGNDALRAVPLLWVTGASLYRDNTREVIGHAITLQAGGNGRCIIDIDYRPSFWRSTDAARTAMLQVLPMTDIVVGTSDEAELVTGMSDAADAALRLLELGPRTAVVKLGKDGCLARTRDELVEVLAIPAQVACSLGAGDAFGGAFCHGLLGAWDLARSLRFAVAAASIVVSRIPCSDAMPTVGEVEAVLESGAHA